MLISLFITYGCFCAIMVELCHCNRGLQSWEYLLSDPSQEKFAHSCSNLLFCLMSGRGLVKWKGLRWFRGPRSQALFGCQVAVEPWVCQLTWRTWSRNRAKWYHLQNDRSSLLGKGPHDLEFFQLAHLSYQLALKYCTLFGWVVLKPEWCS